MHLYSSEKNSICIHFFMSLTKAKVTARKNCRSSTIFADLSQPTDVHFKYFTTPEQTVKWLALMLSRVISWTLKSNHKSYLTYASFHTYLALPFLSFLHILPLEVCATFSVLHFHPLANLCYIFVSCIFSVPVWLKAKRSKISTAPWVLWLIGSLCFNAAEKIERLILHLSVCT